MSEKHSQRLIFGNDALDRVNGKKSGKFKKHETRNMKQVPEERLLGKTRNMKRVHERRLVENMKHVTRSHVSTTSTKLETGQIYRGILTTLASNPCWCRGKRAGQEQRG